MATVIGILVLAAIVGVWMLAERGAEKGLDGIFNGVERLFDRRKSQQPDESQSMVLRDDEDL